MPKMFMIKQELDGILKDPEWLTNAMDFPHVLAAGHPLFDAPTGAPKIEKAPPIELIEPLGLVTPGALQPVWEWVGSPPVLQVKALGWRATEDLKIAFELEQQIRRPAYAEIDWALEEARVIDNWRTVYTALGIPASYLGACETVPDVPDQIDRDIINDLEISTQQISKGRQP